MAKVLIGYFSKGGHTKSMAENIGKSIQNHGNQPEVKSVTDIEVNSLLEYDAIILGSSVYYGSMAAEVKHLLDRSVSLHGKLENKVGGAFSSSANIAGGNETTVMDIIHGLLIHGMIIQGMHHGDHYGPVSVERVDDKCIRDCDNYGKHISDLLNKLQY